MNTLHDWVTATLDGRVDKSWTPMLVASPDVVRHFPEVAGMLVESDDDLPRRTLQIRTATAVAYDIESYAAGDVMAEYSRVPLPLPPVEEEES